MLLIVKRKVLKVRSFGILSLENFNQMAQTLGWRPSGPKEKKTLECYVRIGPAWSCENPGRKGFHLAPLCLSTKTFPAPSSLPHGPISGLL
jgi:hypothetical protein